MQGGRCVEQVCSKCHQQTLRILTRVHGTLSPKRTVRRSSYRESGEGGYGAQGGYAEAPGYGGGEAYGSPGSGGGMRGARNGGSGSRGGTAGGLYDRFGGGYSANGYNAGAAPGAYAADGTGEVEYHSPYARQDRY